MKTSALVGVLVIMMFPDSARAQQSSAIQQSALQSPTIGTVVSSQRSTLIVKTDDGRFVVFALDRETERPKTLARGARVSIESTDDGAPEGARTATRVTMNEAQPRTETTARSEDAIPASVRQVERQIARNVRRYRAGVRAGVGLDPELVSLGVHATLGPIFSRRLLFRPNVEFAYGELTTLFAVNLEGIYRLSQTMPRTSWSPYAGGGPTLGFSHRGFSTPANTNRSFNFGDFTYNGGLTLLAGVEKPSGVFIELKATTYTGPHLRVLFGFTF